MDVVYATEVALSGMFSFRNSLHAPGSQYAPPMTGARGPDRGPWGEDAGPEQPILWLGATGFPPRQRALLDASLARTPLLPQWRIGPFGDADAWLVNGANVRVLPDGNLRVAAGVPTEHALHLDLAEVDRPVAFATPLPDADFEPRCTFDVDSRQSIHAALLQFDHWLRLVRAQFVLGARILRQISHLRQGIFHVNHEGRLLAVFDFHEGKAGLLPEAHPVDLWEARWDRRPVGASDLPPGFLQCTPAQFAWAYVRRTDRDLLPPRYASEPIFFRHAPKVPLRWLSDSQLTLLRELSAEPCTLDILRQRTSLPVNQLRRDLACLYYAGSITTTLAKARPAIGGADNSPHSSNPCLDSLLDQDNAARAHVTADLTAPAPLRQPYPTEPASDR